MTRLPKKYFKSISDYVRAYYTAYGAKRAEKLYDCVKTVTKGFTLTNAVYVNLDPETGLPLIRYFASEDESMSKRFTDLPECVFHLYFPNSKEMSSTFAGSSVVKVYIHGQAFNSMWYAFSGCKSLVEVGELSTEQVISFGGMFNGCSKLTAIPKMKLQGTASNDYAFNGTKSATSFDGYDILGNFNLSSMTLLSHDELVKIIGNLQTLTEKGKYTLTLGTTLLNKLSDEEKAVATDEKGWVLA